MALSDALALEDAVKSTPGVKFELLCDPMGEAGQKFGVGQGWRPEDAEMSPYLKLFGMLWGLGAWATLPAVIGVSEFYRDICLSVFPFASHANLYGDGARLQGYIGNPFKGQPWIEEALAQGQLAGRWPNNALELNAGASMAAPASTWVKQNKFAELPVVGAWPRRPLELATLRLQNMLGISMKDWDALKPTDEALAAGVLTQLGGCICVGAGSRTIFEWKDPGICAVANFEDILDALGRAPEDRVE